MLIRGVLLTYLPTYLLNLSQHYDGDVDVMCNSLLHIFVRAAIVLQKPAKLVQHLLLFYFIAQE